MAKKTAKKMTVKKTAKKTSLATGRKTSRKKGQKTAQNKSQKQSQKQSQSKPLKDPKGGLTAAGREHFAKTEGSHLKPGVKGKADTPEKLKRKGSFLRRHFANPRGPMVSQNGKPTRLALSAHAWGEAVPKTMAAAKKLAHKGEKLLERYHRSQNKEAAMPKVKKARAT